MLILILMNVHYLQNIAFNFEGSNGQNHSLSDSHYPRFPILSPEESGGVPLESTGGGSIYINLKLQNFMLMIIL